MAIAKEQLFTFAGGQERIGGDENKRPRRNIAQFIVVLLCALTLKQFYSTANVNELRWILAPTKALVELVSSSRFQFESYSGYINSDHSFVIAASCAGVNFLLTAFLMLSLGRLWRDRSRNISWGFIPGAAAIAYVATIIANTVRIAVALQLRAFSSELTWLDPEQLHRIEGIVVYFGCLLLLFRFKVLPAPANRQMSPITMLIFPILIYYGTTLGTPLVTAVYRPSNVPTDFRQHLLFVLLVPLVLFLPLTVFRFYKAAIVAAIIESDSGLRAESSSPLLGGRKL